MQETKFWDVISLLNWDEEGDDEHVVRPALEALSQMKEEDIMRFDDIMSEKLHAIDTRDHARFGYLGELDPEVGDEYISPDDFLYLRCAVVAKGKHVYESIRSDPTGMLRNEGFEALLSLASEAYEKRTGREYTHCPAVSYESFTNTAAWEPTGVTSEGKYTTAGVPSGNRRPT
jgi:hypothetical protein